MPRLLPMYEAIVEAIDQEMARDPSVFIMGEDIGVYGGFSAPLWVSMKNIDLKGSGILLFQRRGLLGQRWGQL